MLRETWKRIQLVASAHFIKGNMEADEADVFISDVENSKRRDRELADVMALKPKNFSISMLSTQKAVVQK